MDQIAEKLRAHPQFIESDLQFAFYQLQRDRIGNLSRENWLWLFAMWCDRDRGLQVIDDARFNALCDERERLFSERAALPPEQHAALTARLMEIGTELAELLPTPSAAPLGEWG
jgi:hypothetical protein